MLNRIIAFFRPAPQPTTVTPDPRWQVYKKHLALQHEHAVREKQIGFIPAMVERADLSSTEEDVWGGAL